MQPQLHTNVAAAQAEQGKHNSHRRRNRIQEHCQTAMLPGEHKDKLGLLSGLHEPLHGEAKHRGPGGRQEDV